MTELIIKMTYWLVTAMVLGFIVAWLLARVFYVKQAQNIEESLLDELDKQNNIIKKLEKNISNKKPIYSDTDESSIEAFEEVILLAESKVQESEKTIKSYKEEIKNLEKKVRLYEANRLDEELIISKDQFTKIEEQLTKYQKEIESLKNGKVEKII